MSKQARSKNQAVKKVKEQRAVALDSADALDSYFRSIGRRALLTREGEVEVAGRIEAAERALVAALAACPRACAELASVGKELRAHKLVARDVLRDADEASLADEALVSRLEA